MNIEMTENDLRLASKILDGKINYFKITQDEIKLLFTNDVNNIINYKNELYKSPRGKVLLSIYFKPYLLYYSRNLNEDLLLDFNDFIKKRYMQERKYLSDSYEDGYLITGDYNKQIDELNTYYFYSSFYGMNNARVLEKEKKIKIL